MKSQKSFEASALWDIARAFCTDNFRSPLVDTLVGFIRSRNVKGICEFELPDPALHSQDFVNLRQLQAFFKKNASFSSADICEQNARDSFLQAELRCRLANKRLDHFYDKRGRLDPDLALMISKAESFIRNTLGDVDTFLDAIPRLVKLTGGATEDRSRGRSLPFLKISRRLRTTSGARPLLDTFLTYHGLDDIDFRFTSVNTNRIVYVQKNYKTHRTIACEPTATLPFQLAFDSFVKSRLVRVGCDLSSQQMNQEDARVGSLDGSIATIDLSAASDSLSLNTVAWLLPDEWFSLIRRLRCSRYKGDVGEGTYAKFSSMGNGVTFGLETLIFLAFIRASGDPDGRAYGDDLTVKTECADRLVRLLKFFGFSVNLDKSFVDGPFRESCGADWLNGRLVTPFYVRRLPKTRAELCHVVNGLFRCCLPYGEVWNRLRALVAVLRLPLVPASQDTGTGIHITYQGAESLKLISYCDRYGPYVPCSKQYMEVSDTITAQSLRSYVVKLVFGRASTSLLRFGQYSVPEEQSSYERWSTGLTRRVLKYAPVRPCPSASAGLLLVEAFLLE